jgi:hypothetical protein
MLAVASRPSGPIVVRGMRSCALPRASAFQGSINPALIWISLGGSFPRTIFGLCTALADFLAQVVQHFTNHLGVVPAQTMGAGVRIQDRSVTELALTLRRPGNSPTLFEAAPFLGALRTKLQKIEVWNACRSMSGQ